MSWTVVQIFGNSGECFTFALPSENGEVDFNINFDIGVNYGIGGRENEVVMLNVCMSPECFTGARVLSVKNLEYLSLNYQKYLASGKYAEECCCPDPELSDDKTRRFHPGDDISSFIQKHELTSNDRIFLRCGDYDASKNILFYNFESGSWFNPEYPSEN